MPCLAKDSTCSTFDAELTAFSIGIDDALFDVEGWGAFINDADEGYGNLDVREQVNRQPIKRGGSQDNHGERQHQNADAIP